MQATKEQLIKAANRLLNRFENLDRWPKLSVLMFNFVGDGLRDAVDPYSTK